MQLTLDEVANICDGVVDARWRDIEIAGVSTDTRTIKPGELFVALVGEHHDGHDFVPEAFERQAAAAMVTGSAPAWGDRPLVVVQDTLLAYGKIAAYHRDRFDVTIAAITGSSGKTTTKNLAGAVLAMLGTTLVAPGTENNEIGVPRVLLRLTESHRFCVVEMAMRGCGEIAYLAGLVRPRIGVITNVGQAHIGRLGSRRELARAKAELLAKLPAGGVAVLNADDFFFDYMAETAPCRILSFALQAEADVTAEHLRPRGLAGTDFLLKTPSGHVEIRLRLPGLHNVSNALAAAAVGVAAGARVEQIKAGLEAVAPEQMRTQVIHAPKGFAIINDAYNANPDSMTAALQLLATVEGRKIAVLGDMLELGDKARAAHERLGACVAEGGIDWLITVGEFADVTAEQAAARGVQVDVVDNPQAAVSLLRPALRAGDTVLVKASRALALERVVEGLLHDDA